MYVPQAAFIVSQDTQGVKLLRVLADTEEIELNADGTNNEFIVIMVPVHMKRR